MIGSGVPGFRGSGVLLAVALFVSLAGARAGSHAASRAQSQTSSTASPVFVIFDTELGSITMAVDVEHAPVTAKNFLRYVDEKFYDEGVVNRAVRPDNTVRHDVEI